MRIVCDWFVYCICMECDLYVCVRPDESHPIGIKPFNVPTEPSMEEYKRKYPDGFYQPYKLQCDASSTSNKIEPTPVGPENAHPVNVVYANTSHVSMGSLFLALLVGLVGGIGVTVVVMNKRRKNYEYELIQ